MVTFVLSFFGASLLSQKYGESLHFSFVFSILPIVVILSLYFKNILPEKMALIFIVALGFFWGWGNYRKSSEPLNPCVVVAANIIQYKSFQLASCRNGVFLFRDYPIAQTRGEFKKVGATSKWISRFRPVQSTSMINILRAQLSFKLSKVIDESVVGPVRELYRSIFIPGSVGGGVIARQAKDVGIYHLFVVSGFHVFIFSRALLMIMLLIPRAMYLACVLTPTRQVFFNSMAWGASTALVIAIVSFQGMSLPCQRALLTFICISLVKEVLGVTPLLKQMWMFAFLIHILVEPHGVWTLSFGLSWLAYSILLFSGERTKSFAGILWIGVKRQILLSIAVLSLLGHFPALGVLANLFLSHLFSLFLVSMLAGFIFRGFDWSFMIFSFQNYVLEYLSFLSDKSMFVFSLENYVGFRKMAFLLILAVLFFRLKNESSLKWIKRN